TLKQTILLRSKEKVWSRLKPYASQNQSHQAPISDIDLTCSNHMTPKEDLLKNKVSTQNSAGAVTGDNIVLEVE
ncbi:hypothetical protein ACLOJK_003786, partial [Asimina triloba]